MRDEETEKGRPEERLALFTFCHLRGWTAGDLAKALGMKPSQMSVYTRGQRPAPREVLEKAALAAGFPPYLLDPLLTGLRSLQAGVAGRCDPESVLTAPLALELIGLLQDAAKVAFEKPPPSPAEDRAEVEKRWEILQASPDEDRRLLVEELEEFQTRALAERVARAGREAAKENPEEAKKLEELARGIAERAV
jgi:transcriptional regulator with XRE-family HTH domain